MLTRWCGLPDKNANIGRREIIYNNLNLKNKSWPSKLSLCSYRPILSFITMLNFMVKIRWLRYDYAKLTKAIGKTVKRFNP